MSENTYAFIYSGSGDWRKSSPDDWDLDVVQLDGNEKVIGHRQIDGSICKIVQSVEGRLYALTK